MSRWKWVALALASALVLASEASAQSRKPGEPPPPEEPRQSVNTRKPGEPPPAVDQPDTASPAVGLDVPDDDGSLPIKNSLTLGPAELASPGLKLMYERGLAKKVSIGTYGIAARVSVLDPVSNEATRAGLYALGAQGRYYFAGGYLGGFWGSLDVGYTFLNSDQLVDLVLSNTAAGLSVGALLGFKLVTDVGFTFDLGAGARVLAYKPKPSIVTTSPDADKPGNLLFSLQAQAGWSF